MDYFRNLVVKTLSETESLKGKISKEELNAIIEQPPDRKMGDYAFPCFKLAPIMKKNPQETATTLQKSLKLPKGLEKIETAGSYLNFFVDKGMLAGSVISEILEQGENYGKSSAGKNEQILVEFCQANPLKAFHIGHTRNIVLGEFISKMLEFNGYKIVRVNFQGDVGPHVSRALWAYKNFYAGKEPKGDKGKWLGELYAFASKKIKEDTELEQKMRDMVIELYNGDKKLIPTWKKLRKWSLDYFESIYKQLGINFDRLYFESELEKSGKQIAEELLKKGFAVESEGAIVVDLERYALNKFLILKSDGMPLYSSKDFGLAKLKKKEYPKATKTINVVGAEQDFYFRQLIKTIDLLIKGKKFGSYCPTTHLSYGLVMLSEGKMASREGVVVLYATLYEKMYSSVLKETAKRHKGWTKKRISDNAEQISLAAIKFGMLNRENNKVITFDWEKALSLEGETGPYLQYAYARAKSVLRKGKVKKINAKSTDFSILKDATEQEVVSLLAGFPSVVERSRGPLSPHILCNYLVSLSAGFNSFYQKIPILNAEKKEREARLALLSATLVVLETGLNLLGIKALEEM